MEQKQAAIEILVRIINIHQEQGDDKHISLGILLHDFLQAGLVPLVILLIQRIKNQKWFRENNLSLVKQNEINDMITSTTLSIIQLFSQLSSNSYSASKTLGAFVDKIDFFSQLV